MTLIPNDASAYIFDLDGTLLDTEPLYTEASQQVLNPYGHTYTLELKRKVMGGSSTRSAQLTIEEFNLPLTPEEYLALRQQHLETLFPKAQEISGANDYLWNLRQRDCQLGLATSSHSAICEMKIQNRGWSDLFNIIVCGDDDGLAASKPAPDIFLLCAERLSIDPARAVAFEDSRNGILAARSAGMFVVALDSPYVQPEDIQDADLIIQDFTELL